jgi:hypothetical protein
LAQASKALVSEAQNQIEHRPETTQFPLPGIGEVRFYFMTYSGVLLAKTTERDLTSDKNPLSPLYRRAQDTLSQLRWLSEKKRK